MRKLAKRLVSPDSGLVCPTHWSGPDWVYTDGPAVAELNAASNFAPDAQQQLGLDLIFAVGRDGLPASFGFCVVCCRQNLKTGLLKQAAIGWLFVTDERKVVWSAHEMSTTGEAQKELAELMEDSPALSRRMLPQKNRGVYTDNGSERIELRHNGVRQVILFKARRKTGGRGLSGDKVVLDEAFALQPSHTGSLLPTMAARPHGQVLYASSACLADSTVLRDVRDRGRSGASPRLSYLEWGGAWRECGDPDCAHPKDAEARGLDCALDDRELWRANNPTISTGRISEQTIADLRQELTPDEFARECMGRHDEPDEGAGPPALNLRKWRAAKAPETPASPRAAVVIDVEPDGSAATVGVAGDGPAGRVLLLQTHKPGTAWVVGQVKALHDNAEVLEVALHPSTPAGFLGPKLTAAGIEWHKLVHTDLAQGCSGMVDGIDQGAFVHVDQDDLTDAVAVARTKSRGDATVWDRAATPGVPIGPVVATATAAHRWAVLTSEAKPPPATPRRAGAGGSSKVRTNDVAHAGF